MAIPTQRCNIFICLFAEGPIVFVMELNPGTSVAFRAFLLMAEKVALFELLPMVRIHVGSVISDRFAGILALKLVHSVVLAPAGVIDV